MAEPLYFASAWFEAQAPGWKGATRERRLEQLIAAAIEGQRLA